MSSQAEQLAGLAKAVGHTRVDTHPECGALIVEYAEPPTDAEAMATFLDAIHRGYKEMPAPFRAVLVASEASPAWVQFAYQHMSYFKNEMDAPTKHRASGVCILLPAVTGAAYVASMAIMPIINTAIHMSTVPAKLFDAEDAEKAIKWSQETHLSDSPGDGARRNAAASVGGWGR